MSVVVQNSYGWVLDACSLIDQGHLRCVSLRNNHHCIRYFKRRCFNIVKTHVCEKPRSNAEDNTGNRPTADGNSLRKPAKKRKRKHEANQGEIDAQAYHDRIRSVILEGTTSLMNAVRPLCYLNDVITNEAKQDHLPDQDCNLAAFCDMAKELPLADDSDQEAQVQHIDAENSDCASQLDLFSRMTENITEWALEVSLMGETYLIPPHTAFLLSDFTKIQPLVNCGRRFELILMDPPWENKSVKRSGRYSSLPSSQLKFLPVPLLACPGCLVVTWVTNKASHRRFVREELFPHWEVEVLAEWFWVKVTAAGEFVFPLDSPHKKPYEVLVLGRYRGNSPPSSSGTSGKPVEDQRIIVSVPSAFHSHKPSVSEVLRPYVGTTARCLELFARCLHPGWTSWGNEVLKFQHAAYFETIPPDPPVPATPPRTDEAEAVLPPSPLPTSSRPQRANQCSLRAPRHHLA